MTCYNDMAERTRQQEEGRMTEWEVEARKRFDSRWQDEDYLAYMISENLYEFVDIIQNSKGVEHKLSHLVWEQVERDMEEERRGA